MKNFFLDNLDIFRGIHEGSWAFVAILFLVTVLLLKNSSKKFATISHMILRLFYVLMLLSGLSMIIAFDFPLFYTLKGILALVMVGFMEICCARMKRNTSYFFTFILSIILLIVVLLMGFRIISF